MLASSSLTTCLKLSAGIVAVMIAAECTSSSESGETSSAERKGQPRLTAGAARQAESPPQAASVGPQESAPQSSPNGHETRARRSRDGRPERKPFDPIRDNGPIFVGWPAPKLAIVITGRQDGYLEPCGCAGLDRMRGGLSRRHSMVDSLRKKGWPLVLLDVGGLSKRFGPQAMLKFRTSVEAMTKMDYQAVGLGTAELRFSAAELVTLVAGEQGRPSRFVSANVGLFGHSSQITPRKRIIRAAGLRLGVTSVLGRQYQREIHNPDIEMTDPETELSRLVPELRRACDLIILLAHATKQESVALAQRFPAFDVVVTAGGLPVPPAEPAQIEGSKALLIEVGEKEKDAVVLGVFDDPSQPLRYQRTPLDSRFPASADMKSLMVAYQEELRQLGLEGLGVRPMPHPRKAVQGNFIGSKRCAPCHKTSYEAWMASGHAKATRTLVKFDPPHQFDPECITCHVTGWRPQSCFPYDSGYLGLDTTPNLEAVGCESCHGPGEAHAAAELEGNEALKQKLRRSVAVAKADAKQHVCSRCHDVNNSPDFEFEAYWSGVAHHEDK